VRYLIGALTLATLVVAAGVARVRHGLACAALAIVVLAGQVPGVIAYFELDQKPRWRTLVAHLEHEGTAEDAIIYLPRWMERCTTYNRDVPGPLAMRTIRVGRAAGEPEIAAMLEASRGARNVWLIDTYQRRDDNPHVAWALMRAREVLSWTDDPKITVVRFGALLPVAP
jgi:hypothetical protein